MAVLLSDLHTRVISAYEATGNKRQVCLQFNIARTTLIIQVQPSSCAQPEQCSAMIFTHGLGSKHVPVILSR